MNSIESESEPSGAIELTFPDSSDLSYPDSTNIGTEDRGPSTEDLRDQLVTPEPDLIDKHGLSEICNNVPDTSSDFPNPPDDLPAEFTDSTNDFTDAINPQDSFKAFSIDLSSNLIGQISTDDSGFCLSSKDFENVMAEEEEAAATIQSEETSRRVQSPVFESAHFVNGDNRNVEHAESQNEASSSSPKAEENHMDVEAYDIPETGNLIENRECAGDVVTDILPSEAAFDTTSNVALPTNIPEQDADDYLDSDMINDIDDSAADAEVRNVDSSTAQAEEPNPVDANNWRQFPIVFFNKEDEEKLTASNENLDKDASRSRHASSARSTPEIVEEGDSGSRAPTPNWATDGSNVLETFDDFLSLLPCDLRGWAVHKSDCGSRLAFVHSVLDFKTLYVKADVTVVFEREKQKLKKSLYNLPKDPPLDRSTRHLLDDARGSRGRSSARMDESYPDSKSDESPRWNFIIKYMSSGLSNKMSGPRSLSVDDLRSVLRFALRPPAGLKRKYSEADVDEIIEEQAKRGCRTTSSPAPNGPVTNAKQASGSMLECFKCKRLVTMDMWSQHPCFQQAVKQPNPAPKRGGGSRNDVFCKFCKLRFADAYALKGHEIKFPGGSCNMVINCSICKRKFFSRGSYAIHLQGAEGKKCKKGMFRCQVCKSFWADDLELIDHFRKSHTCIKCKFQPNTFEDYDAHSRSCFRPNVASYQPNQFVPPSSTAALNAPGSQSCRHCLLIFGSPAELAVHLRTSRACGDAMKLPSAVNQPQLNAIRCQQCRKTFSSHQDLADHVKRFHNQQAYLHRCIYCPKNFATAEMLKAHCSKVHGNASAANSYDCKVCSLKFISFSGLSRHLKMKHGIRGGNQNDAKGAGVGAVGGGASGSGGAGVGAGGGGATGSGGSARSFQYGTPAASVGVNVSSVSSPVTLDFKNFTDSLTSSKGSKGSPLPTENKTLSEKDFLFGNDSPGDVGGGGGGGVGASLKCSNCFLFFDDPVDYAQHRTACN